MAAHVPVPAVALCGHCGQHRGVLLSLASEGALLQVCRVCYCCHEIRQLAELLPPGGDYEALGDGLETLYTLVRTAVTELDAPQGGRQGQGQGESRG